jgi:hypothetical protein
MMRYAVLFVITGIALAACNPFAPGITDSIGSTQSLLGDQRSIEGLFENFAYAYKNHQDTIAYGKLIGGEFTFLYRDYDRGVDVSWGRDEEMRTTNSMFQSVQQLDLVWNNIVSSSINTDSTQATVSRNFNLTVMFNPGDVIRVDGYAIFTLTRRRAEEPWLIVRWRDESNF